MQHGFHSVVPRYLNYAALSMLFDMLVIKQPNAVCTYAEEAPNG
jgi:hypothetical protein